MTTKNPRLTITMNPSLAAQLREMSRLTGNSQSALIADLLDGSGPVFDRLITVLRAAEGAKAAVKGRLAEDMGQAQAKMESHLGIAMDLFGDATQSLLDVSEEVKRRARKGAGGMPQAPTGDLSGAKRTPISNRGVRSTATTSKSIAPNRYPAKVSPGKQGVKARGVKP